MKWLVTYRNREGRQEELEIEASDRRALFEELARRGISAIRTAETNGRAKSRPKQGGRPPVSLARLGAFAVVGAVLAFVAFKFLSNGGGTAAAKRDSARTRITESAPSTSTPRQPASAVSDRTRLPDAPRGKADGRHAAAPASAGGRSSSAAENAAAAKEPEAQKKRRRIFNSGTDELIALATCAPEGGSIPPLPAISRQDTDRFIASLSEPIEIEEGDSKEIVALKERVHQVRMELVQVFKDNPDAELSDILNEHRELFNHNSKLYAEAKREYDEILSSGDVEGARAYREGMNGALSEMGIKQIENEEDTNEEDQPEEEK